MILICQSGWDWGFAIKSNDKDAAGRFKKWKWELPVNLGRDYGLSGRLDIIGSQERPAGQIKQKQISANLKKFQIEFDSWNGQVAGASKSISS